MIFVLGKGTTKLKPYSLVYTYRISGNDLGLFMKKNSIKFWFRMETVHTATHSFHTFLFKMISDTRSCNRVIFKPGRCPPVLIYQQTNKQTNKQIYKQIRISAYDMVRFTHTKMITFFTSLYFVTSVQLPCTNKVIYLLTPYWRPRVNSYLNHFGLFPYIWCSFCYCRDSSFASKTCKVIRYYMQLEKF